VSETVDLIAQGISKVRPAVSSYVGRDFGFSFCFVRPAEAWITFLCSSAASPTFWEVPNILTLSEQEYFLGHHI